MASERECPQRTDARFFPAEELREEKDFLTDRFRYDAIQQSSVKKEKRADGLKFFIG